MIPAALVAALAITRLGAIHAVVFGGFAAQSLAQRLEASRPRLIMTASCGVEGAKGTIDYRPLVEGAIRISQFKPSKVLIWQRDVLRWNNPNTINGQLDWQQLVESARIRGLSAGPVPVKSTDGLYIIYTSGKSHILHSFQKCKPWRSSL
jgi:propionyl-CoA synthetase